MENANGKLFLNLSVFICSNITCAAASGSMMKGMWNSFLSVSCVRMKPGLTTCTCTPVLRRSAYMHSAKDIVPALDAVYPIDPGSPRNPVSDDVITICPASRATMPGTTCPKARIMPVKLISAIALARSASQSLAPKGQ